MMIKTAVVLTTILVILAFGYTDGFDTGEPEIWLIQWEWGPGLTWVL